VSGRGPAPVPVVLVLRALGLGDLLTAVPALRGVHDAFPHHRVVLATPAGLAPLVRLTGAVDGIVDTAGLGPLPAALAGPDVAVNLHGRGPDSHRRLLALAPRRMIAFGNEHVAVGGPQWRDDEHEVARWCRLLTEHGIPADLARLDLSSPGPPLPGREGVTIIHPGAASASRRWPADRWAEVGRELRRDGHRVVVTGARSELQLAERVAAGAGVPGDDVLAGRTDLLTLARLVAGAGLLLSGDTGVAHLATALATPSVVLFGPVPPSEWGPPPDRPWHRALWAGRRGDPHGTTVDPGLRELRVAEVLEAVDGQTPWRRSGREPLDAATGTRSRPARRAEARRAGPEMTL